MELTTNVAAFAELPSLLKRVVASEKQRVIVVNALSRGPSIKTIVSTFLKIKGSRCKGDPDFAFVCQSWLSARENVAKESFLTGCIETTWERGEASQRKLLKLTHKAQTLLWEGQGVKLVIAELKF